MAAFLLLYFALQGRAQSQDSILFLDGTTRSGAIKEDLGDYFLVEMKVKPGGKTRQYTVDKELIFSVRRQDSITVFYAPDSGNVNDLTVSEMQSYIRGEQVAMQQYAPLVSPASAFVSGFTGAWAGFWGFTVPAVHLGIAALYRPGCKTAKAGISPDAAFEMGYRDAARRIRNRKMARAALGGLVGGWLVKVLMAGLK